MKAVLIAVPALFLVAGCMTTEGADSRPQGHSNGVTIGGATPPNAQATGAQPRVISEQELLTSAGSGTGTTGSTGTSSSSTGISRDNIAGTVSIPTTNPAGTVTAGDRVFNPANL
jgi:hypothetical protein